MKGDLQLAVLGAVVAAVSLAFAFLPPTVPARAGATALGHVQSATGEVKRRPPTTLGWERLRAPMLVFDGDAVFVPPGAETSLRFDDGTELDLDERSLVVIEVATLGVRTLHLRQGSVSGRVGNVTLDIQTPSGTARLEKATEARVELEHGALAVAVTSGRAALNQGGSSSSVGQGQRARVTEAGVTALPAWPVQLVAPSANTRQIFTGKPPSLELRWSVPSAPGARLQIARDRFFAFLDHDESAAEGRLTLERPVPGVTWWRVVDARGLPLSESRRFAFSEDLAPITMLPGQGEVVLAPEGGEVAFAWTPLVGATEYRFELSPSQGFEPITLTQEVTGAQVRLPLALAEGTWFWRVRVADEQHATTPSAHARFRLIHKAIPEAPELLKPEIEVEP